MPEVITNHLDLWTPALLTKSTAVRSSNGRQEAYGIKKLRELILELAVQGKLVPQNLEDEPARVLLRKIAAEKERLIKEGKIKRESPLATVTNDEQPFDIPESWEWVRLGTALRKITDGTHHSPPNGEVGDFLYISAKNIKDDGVKLSNATYVSKEIHEEIYSRCDPELGDVLYIKDGATTGIATINNLQQPFSMLSSVALLKCPQDLLNTYLLLSLRSPYFYSEMRAGMKGVAITRVTLKKLNEAFISLPPLAEQHRIVAKVDELMALCDQLEQQQTHSLEAHQTLVETLLGTLTRVASPQELTEAWTRIASHFDTLFTTEHSIDQLKQTILQLAVMGKLVPQDPNDEPASVLLSRKQDTSEENIPFRIPESWVWARVEEFAQTRLGKMLDKAKNKGTLVRYLRNVNVRWFDFDLSDVKEMRFEESELEEFSLRRGDVLICEGGYPGRAAVWDEREENIYFQKAIHRVRFQNGVNPYYFVCVLRESADSGRLNTYFTGAGIQHFTGKGLASFLVPLPPPPEQHRIVAKVDELMALCDVLKARIKDAQTTQLHLADAIVEQAVA